MEIKEGICPGIKDNNHCIGCANIGVCKNFKLDGYLSDHKNTTIENFKNGIKTKVGAIIISIGFLVGLSIDFITDEVTSKYESVLKLGNKSLENKNELNDLYFYKNILHIIIRGLISISTSLILFLNGLKNSEIKNSKDKSEKLELVLQKLIELYNELKEKEKELSEANNSKLVFLSNLAHELRTPLNIIMGYTDTVKSGLFGELNKKQTEYLEDALSAGRLLLDIINSILESSKIESGNLKIVKGNTNINITLEQVLKILQIEFERNKINVGFTIPIEEIFFNYDEIKIKQVLLNIIKNAIKFTPEGGNIHIKLSTKGDQIIIEITDNGIGINKVDLEKIGIPFKQAENGQELNLQGTGLGLHISKGIIEAHSGEFKIESEGEGKGTKVTIALPKI